MAIRTIIKRRVLRGVTVISKNRCHNQTNPQDGNGSASYQN